MARPKAREPWSYKALIAVSLFGAIVAFCLLMTILGFVSVAWGLLPVNFWTDPVLITVLVLLGSGMLTGVVVLIMQGLVLQPMQGMIDSVEKLGAGNFDVRVEVGEGMHPLEVIRFSEGFNTAAHQLGSVEELRHDFISDFSHEFKTPITSINGYADLLRGENVSDADRRAWADTIYRESRRLTALSSDILLLRQAESTDVLNDAQPVDAAEYVRRAVIVMQGKWAAKNLVFNLDVPDSLVIRGCAAFLERAWSNLLDNACKFSPDGGIVVVCLQTKDDQVELQVENDGPVIAPDALERIFDRFYQDDASHATQGCGLGLSLVQRVARLHGGSVSADSTPEGHTTFILQLPLAKTGGIAR